MAFDCVQWDIMYNKRCYDPQSKGAIPGRCKLDCVCSILVSSLRLLSHTQHRPPSPNYKHFNGSTARMCMGGSIGRNVLRNLVHNVERMPIQLLLWTSLCKSVIWIPVKSRSVNAYSALIIDQLAPMGDLDTSFIQPLL